jgi:hypothetical protein
VWLLDAESVGDVAPPPGVGCEPGSPADADEPGPPLNRRRGRTVSVDYAAGARFTEAKQGATWGGGNGYPAPAGSRVRFSRTYISGR